MLVIVVDIYGRRLPLEMDRWAKTPVPVSGASDEDTGPACATFEPQPAIHIYDPDCSGFDALQLV